MVRNKLKIAVITGGAHYKLGGVENYSAICYEDGAKKYQVTEFPLLKTGLGNINVRAKNERIKIDYALLGGKPYSMLGAKTYPKKIMRQIYQNFDVVIINNPFPPRKGINHPKSILVQHMHLKGYGLGGKNGKVSVGQFFASLFFGIGTLGNAFHKAYRAVFFHDLSTHQLTQLNDRSKRAHFVAIPYKNQQDITKKNNTRSKFVFVGRLENQQKNIKQLVKFANKNNDIEIYGFGHDQKIIDKKLKNKHQFKGLLNKNEIDNVLGTAKALIITSNYEGFPTIAVEALTNGTPIILFDTFESTSFFQKSQAAFLIPKGKNKEFNAKINFIRHLSHEEYAKISQNAIDFAQKYLSKEVFGKNWDKILQNFTQNNKSK